MNHRFYASAIMCVAIGLLSSCVKDSKENQKLATEISFTKEGELSIYSLVKEPPNLVSKLDIEVADNSYEIETGLMYRKSMLDRQGMLFIFDSEAPRSFYMKNTEIPLDIIFIGKNKKVVSIQKNAKPFDETSLPSEGLAQYVLEVNAKLTDTWNLKPGDSIAYTLQ